jgi:hypothetical protein
MPSEAACWSDWPVRACSEAPATTASWALEAAAHGRTLLTLDERAQSTYQRLGVPFRVIG